MATYISLINSVLSRLRVDSVNDPSSTAYSALIGELVNESKRAVEDSWNWLALRTTKTVTTADGTSQYAITGSGDRFRLQSKDESVYDVTNTSHLFGRPASWVKRSLIETPTTGKPAYYYFEGRDASGDTYVNIWQTPDGVYTINFDLVVPQDDFTLGTEVLSVPHWPVILGAFVRALAERGEDQGNTHGEAVQSYTQALGDAIAIDESKTMGETHWYV